MHSKALVWLTKAIRACVPRRARASRENYASNGGVLRAEQGSGDGREAKSQPPPAKGPLQLTFYSLIHSPQTSYKATTNTHPPTSLLPYLDFSISTSSPTFLLSTTSHLVKPPQIVSSIRTRHTSDHPPSCLSKSPKPTLSRISSA